MFHLSQRMESVQDPVIPIIGRLVRETPGTINFGQGVAHYPPPPQALSAYQTFLADPANHKYHPVDGVPILKQKLVEKLQRENGITLNRSSAEARLCVTAGGNMAFLNAVLAITDPGDEIIILAPFYFNHEMAVRIADCKPVFVPTDENYQPNLNALLDAVTERTKAVLTVSPNNPTGAVYPEATLRTINKVCLDRSLYHIHDEAYEYFTYNDATHFSPGSIDNANHHTVSLFSFSKSYGFAGWRIGYMTFPVRLETAIHKIQDTNLICPPIVSQYSAAGALEAGGAYCKQFLSSYSEVRHKVLDELNEIGDLCTIPPADGAFYFFLKINSNCSPMELARRLILEHQVALMPGHAFGMDQGCYLRLSYGALSSEQAIEGTARLKQGLRAIIGSQ
ncbi:MAG: pyridoxal phosphate-dependent aminotransferase [Candidatus Hinthialibacter antarcticus]|nr:pyridoxal phosphate-dependent aminotransferase [Candidatus Hinthialibacter antarcticus]